MPLFPFLALAHAARARRIRNRNSSLAALDLALAQTAIAQMQPQFVVIAHDKHTLTDKAHPNFSAEKSLSVDTAKLKPSYEAYPSFDADQKGGILWVIPVFCNKRHTCSYNVFGAATGEAINALGCLLSSFTAKQRRLPASRPRCITRSPQALIDRWAILLRRGFGFGRVESCQRQ